MLYGPWPRSGRLLRHFSFSSSFLRCPNPGGAGHVQGALAHRAQRGRPLTWPRQDYIARLEEEEKAPQQPAAACGCQGPATAMVPTATAGGQGKEHATRHWCPAAHSPASKRPRVRPRSAATGEGCGGTLPPRRPPAHARAAFASTEARLVRHPTRARGQTAGAVLPVRAARPGLDVGALRHYITSSCKKGGKAAEDQ